jgi:elongation factor 1-alpha
MDDPTQLTTKGKDEICIVVAGSIDAGKSSFVGVLMTNELDNGFGSARSKIAKHPHEVSSGKTSDIACKSLILNNKEMTLVDLCGHEKYLKTTLFGITGYFPDYGVLVVSANRGLLKMTKEHMGILLYMKIPFIIVVTRVDITPKNIYESNMELLNKILTMYKRKIEIINGYDEMSLPIEELQKKELNSKIRVDKIIKRMQNNPYIVPVMTISNKTGYFIDVIKYLLSILPQRNIWNENKSNGTQFYIDSRFNPPGIGLVVSGILKGNSIKTNMDMLIGPYGNEFRSIRVWSIHNNIKEQIDIISNRQRGCLAIRSTDKKAEVIKNSIRKGMIIISKDAEQNICYQFTAEIEILNHSTAISGKYTPVIHCGIVRQSAKIILKEGQVLKIKDTAEVGFRFIQHPEFIEEGTIFFFREGTTRGVGIVKSILSLKNDPDPKPAEPKKNKFRKKRLRPSNKGKTNIVVV